MARRPLCFVLVPFDKRPDPSRPGHLIDFEALYFQAIKPGIEDAGLEAVRAKEEVTLGVIHKPMFERLLLCDFAIAELSVPNANVFYELGIRHASRHNTTLPIFADHTSPPFDVTMLRAMPYRLGPQNETGEAETKALREALADRLKKLRALAFDRGAENSPFFALVGKSQQGSAPADERLRRIKQADAALYELLERYDRHDKTDVFRDLVIYNRARKQELANARALEPEEAAIAALERIHQDLEPFDDVEAAVLVDLYLSYRSLGAFEQMITLYDQMPRSIRRSVLVREQRAFALNRLAAKREADRPRRAEAIQLLQEVLDEIGPNPETLGILGRIYKDRWQEALEAGDKAEARGYLRQAIDAYRSGFEADFRDAYPGINAVTLLDVQGDAEALETKERLLPVVQFAVDRRVAGGKPDYWDVATLLELAILNDNQKRARDLADQALAAVRESWEPATTAKNLGYIAQARRERNLETAWLEEIISDLKQKAASRTPGTNPGRIV